MVAVRVLSVLGVVVMTIAIGFGLASGDFSGQGAEILSLAWGKVTLTDLYVGLALFAGWISLRERNWFTTAMWWVALVALGNLAAAFYLSVAAFRSDDVSQLLLGRAADSN